MCAPVWSPWLTLETCQKPGPRRCGVISTRMLVEGGLIVLLFTATERSMSLAISAPPNLDYSQRATEKRASPDL